MVTTSHPHRNTLLSQIENRLIQLTVSPKGPHHPQTAETLSFGHQTGLLSQLAVARNSFHKYCIQYWWQRAALAEANPNIHCTSLPYCRPCQPDSHCWGSGTIWLLAGGHQPLSPKVPPPLQDAVGCAFHVSAFSGVIHSTTLFNTPHNTINSVKIQKQM